MNYIASVVVTFNRKQLLKENVNALLNQNGVETDIIVVDNASTDGTRELIEMFEEKYLGRILYINTGKNIGGSGGFCIGINEAIKRGYKYAWVMDDDTIPEVGALNSLLTKAEILDDKFSFLSSTVLWTDGSIHRMNKISVDDFIFNEMKLLRENNLIQVGNSSFVACFVNLEYAKKTYLPIRDFFIYGDDKEYTYRLALLEKGYLDLESIVVHKTPLPYGSAVEIDAPERIGRYFYKYRNNIYIRRRMGQKQVIKFLLMSCYDCLRIIKNHRKKTLKRVYMVVKGCIYGMFFNPKLEMPSSDVG